MALDIICGFLLVILTGLGFKSGFITQLTRLAALALIFFGAPALAKILTQNLYGVDAIDQPILRTAMTVLAASVIYVGSMIFSFLFLRSKKEPGKKDRLAGGILGFIKASVIAYLLASSVHYVEGPLKNLDPDDSMNLQESRVLEVAESWKDILPWIQENRPKGLLKTRAKETPPTKPAAEETPDAEATPE